MVWSLMSDVPNPLFDASGNPASGYVLKAFLPGTTTNTSMDISTAGASNQTTITYNAEGKLEVSGNEVEPFIDRLHKWGVFQTAAHATANTPFYQGPYDNVPVGVTTATTEKIFETVALMVASTTLSVGDHVRTLGYLAIGDGGGNEYDVVAAATGTVDGGQYIDLATHQALGLFPGGRVTDRQFGTTGDNSADDTTELANSYAYCDPAVSGPGILYVLGGNLKTTAQWTLNKRVSIKAAKGVSTIKPSGTFIGIKTTFGNIEIDGLSIDGTNLTGVLVQVDSESGVSSSDSIAFRNMRLTEGSTHGFNVLSGDRGLIDNCNISNVKGDAIRADGRQGADSSVSVNSWTLLSNKCNGHASGTGIGLNLLDTFGGSATDNWKGDGSFEGFVGGGCQIASDKHRLDLYLEDNTAADLTLTTTAAGNWINLLAVETVADIVNNSASNDNVIWSPLQGFIAMPSIGNTPPGTAIAGSDVSIAGGANSSSASAVTAGKLNLLGGAAAGTNCNGGDVFLKGREGSGSGNQGSVDINGPIKITTTTTTTWDPGSIADGDEEAKEITVTGALLGEFALASFSLDVQDLALSVSVTAADTVTAVLSNNTGGAIDLGSGTLRVKTMAIV